MHKCEKCKDMLFVLEEINGVDVAKPCSCREKVNALLMLKKSGISDELQSKGFKEFDTRGLPALEDASSRAKRYYQSFRENEKTKYNSIILCGQVGSGKTHLGMAICNNLLNICNVGIVYMAYRNAINELKQSMNEKETYRKVIEPYLDARALYIDDMLKGKISESDLNILYEIVNYRYMHNKPMIISTEFTPDQLMEWDEAVGSRILEMCRGNIICLQGAELNYRLYSQKR